MDTSTHVHPTGIAPLEAECAPGGVIVFHADEPMEVLGLNGHAIELLGCESEAEALSLFEGGFTGIACEEDRPIARDFVRTLREHPGRPDYRLLRIRKKSKEVTNVAVNAVVVAAPDAGVPICNALVAEFVRHRPFDWLTGLPTMKRFGDFVRSGKADPAHREAPAVIAFFDLTGFKSYNDVHGRRAGDKVLRLVARLLTRVFGNDACARIGEDHFCAIGELTSIEERVRALISAYDDARTQDTPPLRAGIAVCEDGEDITVGGLARAKTACDLDHLAWESRLTWYTPEMGERERMRAHVLESLDRAIDEGWIRPHYQSIFRSSTGAVCGEEALARWIDPIFGFVSPGVFIPAVEEAGIAHRLDLHMVDCVVADICAKRRRGVVVVPVSVNFSVRDLAQIDIAAEVSRRADAHDVDHALIVVELTESAASTNPDLFRSQVARLHEAGFRVWMDDFGSGYSSLNILQEFDFDLVKLDMAFVAGLTGDRREQARIVVASILTGVRRMGLDTLAEGVETKEQALFLQSAGCNMLQGYLLARPRPIEDVLSDDTGQVRERLSEVAYGDTVARLMLEDLHAAAVEGSFDLVPTGKLPVGVIELRGETWRVLRANEPYRAFLDVTGLVPACRDRMLAAPIDASILDPEFPAAALRAMESGSWERVIGSIEYGTGYQFYLWHLASLGDANAFSVLSVPVLLGSSVGGFGDVPVAYAIYRVTLDGDGTIAKVTHSYGNDRYRELFKTGEGDLLGRSLITVIPDAPSACYPLLQRALASGETITEVRRSEACGHWLSISVATCSLGGYCMCTFAVADRPQEGA